MRKFWLLVTYTLYFTLPIEIDALEFYRLYFFKFVVGVEIDRDTQFNEQKFVYENIAPYYVGFNLLERIEVPDTWIYRIQSTRYGSSFYAMLELKGS